MKDNEWNEILARFPPGQPVTCTIRKVWALGMLLDVDDVPGLMGILRNRELSWDEPIADITQFRLDDQLLAVGQKLRLRVLRPDARNRQLQLSLRWEQYDPWEQHASDCRPGEIVRGRVETITHTDVYLELPTHLTARLPRDEIVPWPIQSVDEVLLPGDTIEAIVTGQDENLREIEVSMKQCLEQRASELLPDGDHESPWSSKNISDSESTAQPGLAADFLARPIDTILVVDDDLKACQLMEDLLSDLGSYQVTPAYSFEEAALLTANNMYDLVLLDVKDGKGDRVGLKLAENMLADHPDLLVVLVTGDDWFSAELNGLKPDLSGMIQKPVTLEKLAGALSNLERVRHAGWPLPLDQPGRESIEFVQKISLLAAERRPLSEALALLLDQLRIVTHSDRAALFSMNLRTAQVAMVASINLAQEKVRPWLWQLIKSPVKDVIFRREHLLENDVYGAEGKYHYLLRAIDFKACLGVPVEGVTGDTSYGLFLLRSRAGQFNEFDMVRAEAGAAILGRAIQEHWVIQQVARDQRSTMMGGVVTSLAHELRGRLGALEAVGLLQKNWKEIKANPERSRDLALQEKIDQHLEQIASARAGMMRLFDVFLDSARQGQSRRVELAEVLRTVIAVIAYEARRESVTIDDQINWLPPITANPVEMEQVFMNIMLNAVQQMKKARRRRGRVTVTTEFDQSDTTLPIKIRFIDTGPGIHYKDAERIFEPMFTTKEAGTGMGLYICRELLGRIGGRICLESTAILAGATFLIELPGGTYEN